MARRSKRISAISGYVLYLRTSDEDVQAPERSQNAQRRDIRQRLISQVSLPCVEEYVDNYTGTSADRKHYQRMLRDVRDGKFSHVFAAVPDRFGRDDVEALRAIDEMTALGIKVRFASHPDLDPGNEDDRLYLNILFGMAKRESAVIARRCKGGMLSKLLSGGWPWHAPDGYVNREVKLTELEETDETDHLRHARYKRWIEKDPEQAKVWRYAWDLLLEDKLSLQQICETLYQHGYRLRSGMPFVSISPSGKRTAWVQILSRILHNWAYAGWVVVENDWANIPPKTVRAEWEPIVTTEEFERGLAILARRQELPTPKKRHFYLLQGMIYLRHPSGELEKLTCSMPNSNRARGGVSYYCIPSSSMNFLCYQVDIQVTEYMHHVQIDPDLVPRIRRAYLADVDKFTTRQRSEQEVLQAALQRTGEKEINLWRAFTEHGMRPAVYEKLAREYDDERQRIELALELIKRENKEYVANLDAALEIIAQIAERYSRQSPERQRDILRHMVKKVILDPVGRIIRLDLKPPFTYLQLLAQGEQAHPPNGGNEGQRTGSKRKRTSPEGTGSFHITLGDPTETRTKIARINTCKIREPNHFDLIERNSSVGTFSVSGGYVREK